MARRPRLLVIDDEEEMRALLCEYFDEMGYTVDTAPTGAAALVVIREQPPDVVLLDMALAGGLDGGQVLEAIRAHWPSLPVIMVTANISEEIARATLEMGAFDYVMKPFDIRRLGEIVALAATTATSES